MASIEEKEGKKAQTFEECQGEEREIWSQIDKIASSQVTDVMDCPPVVSASGNFKQYQIEYIKDSANLLTNHAKYLYYQLMYMRDRQHKSTRK